LVVTKSSWPSAPQAVGPGVQHIDLERGGQATGVGDPEVTRDPVRTGTLDDDAHRGVVVFKAVGLNLDHHSVLSEGIWNAHRVLVLSREAGGRDRNQPIRGHPEAVLSLLRAHQGDTSATVDDRSMAESNTSLMCP